MADATRLRDVLAILALLVALVASGCSESGQCPDGDGDGYRDTACGGDDCDDGDPGVNPGTAEVCGNGVDDDCSAGTPDIFDADGDGDACDADCDDADPDVGPGRAEIPCNSVDDDCNADTPDDQDADSDGWTACAGDCSEEDPAVNPGAAEICGNGIDDDCSDGTPDIFDADGDGDACDADCDDSDPGVGPSRAEACAGGIDEDCDGKTDCDDVDCADLPECLICGNGIVQGDEQCDDANSCDKDGCSACVLEQTVVMNSAGLIAGVGFDLNNQDGDDDIYTGIDNRMATHVFLRGFFTDNIRNYLEEGVIIQLFTFGGLDNVPYQGQGTPGYEEDDDIVVSGYLGMDPACPPTPAVVPWLDQSNAPWDLYSDADSFSGCEPQFMITDAHDPENGIHPVNTHPDPQPLAPFVHLHTPYLSISIGGLGLLVMSNAYIEASVLNDGEVLTGLQNGVFGGIIPAYSLCLNDISEMTSGLCPTALHVMIATIGNPDQDDEGNGTLDTIEADFDPENLPCLASPVIITGCTDDETGEYIPGGDCALDPRIGDGYSAAFTFTAVHVHMVGQVSGSEHCQ